MPESQTDYDSPWKEAIERYFEEFISFFFPPVHAGIDWTRGYEFLDKELQKVVRDAELGRRLADKLVKVWTKEGEEAWVLVHLEVQGDVERDFGRRMYVYNYRLFDRYGRRVASLAILADSNSRWRPQAFSYELWGCRVLLEFPAVKLLDYEPEWAALEQNLNPFSIIVMTHLKAEATHRDAKGRLHWKLTLVKILYRRGYKRKDILELFRFIDWLLALPEDLELSFTESLRQYEEEIDMPYVTSVERRGIRKGVQQGIQQGIRNAREALVEILEARFETVPAPIAEVVNRTEDLSSLKLLLTKAATAASLEEFQAALDKIAHR